MNDYIPPFNITNKMLDLVASIMEKIGRLDNYNNLNKMPILRRNNKIRSIHSSLRIEANSLTFNQVKDVINGKMVIGPQKEIQEVKNAYNAYEMINKVDPYSIDDLKKIHGIMTYLTVEESGDFRKGDEGVMDGDICIFIAPKPEYVDKLMRQLFDFIKRNKDIIHPLILSSVFHYEFVFIHPFSDGNGRTVRLWQNILLTKWKSIFEYVPIETAIKKYQNDYYKAMANCNAKGDSTEFIEFMLKMIDEVLDDLIKNANIEIEHINSYIAKLLDVMDYNIPMSIKEIMEKLGLKSRSSFMKTYLNPALEQGLIKMTIKDKPTSKNQRYYKD